MIDRRGVSLGIALAAVGLYVLLQRWLDERGPALFLIVLGGVFFAISAVRRFRGPLLPAGVLVGLGAGMLLRNPLEEWMPHWAAILLGLGAGFLLVAAIDRGMSRSRRLSPLLPGIALVAIALAEAASRVLPLAPLWAWLEPFWPVALLAAGAALIAISLRRRRT